MGIQEPCPRCGVFVDTPHPAATCARVLEEKFDRALANLRGIRAGAIRCAAHVLNPIAKSRIDRILSGTDNEAFKR